MLESIRLCAGFLAAMFRSRAALQAENPALRHQLCVYQRSAKRPKVRQADRVFWSLLAKAWTGWKDTLIFAKPDTVIRWQRRRFKEHWRKLSGSGEPGQPPVADEVKELIRTMSSMNPTWRAFLRNHAKEIVSIDFMVVPTVRFQILYVLLFLSIERRHIVHFAVTQHPTAAWAAQQAMEAFPWDTAPRYLLRDRDSVYGDWFRRRVKNMGIEEVLMAPHSPWQNPYSERLNGSLRRERLNHIIVFSENHLRQIIADYVAYYNGSRTHLSLEMDSPVTRPVQTPDHGKVISLPQVGGLHHRYERPAP